MMVSSMYFFLDDLEDVTSNNTKIELIRKKKFLRDISNPLELPIFKFQQYFRLNKEAFSYLLDELEDKFITTNRSSSVPNILKLSAALRFFADGSYQKSVSNDFNLGLAQSTTSMILSEVINILEQNICPKWIKTNMTDEEKFEAKVYFYEKTGVPGVIGSVDGTHIKIIALEVDSRNFYMNRKGYYAMIACDHKMIIRNVDARFAGSNYDSFIFSNSSFKAMLEQNYLNGERNTWYLGDSGYPLFPYLKTPFRTALNGSNESKFNTAHAKARNIVKRTIGVLKNRFRCLLGARELHYKSEKSVQIVNCCSALHNICIEFNVVFPEIEIEDSALNVTNAYDNYLTNLNYIGKRIRNEIMLFLV